MKKGIIVLAMMAIVMTGTSCANKQKKVTEVSVAERKGLDEALEVDSLLGSAERLLNKEVTVKGICTHTCKHSAKKIFLMGSDDTQTIRVEAGKLGSFDSKCVNSMVRVTGLVREHRIDEAYLQSWEDQVKAQSKEEHGNDASGCSTEKKARGETGNTTQERIADFRMKIAQSKEKTGKDYLSFYFIEAMSYEVEE